VFATGTLFRVGFHGFYTAMACRLSIPTGLQILCWLATMWDGRPRFPVPMLVVGFIITFVIGGLSGVIIAAVPDLQLHDTCFIGRPRFHCVLQSAARCSPLLGILTYLVSQDHQPVVERTLGEIGFWMRLAPPGSRLAFFPTMHFAGLLQNAAGLHPPTART